MAVQLTPEEMDKAAEEFKAALDKLPQTVTIPIARLWKAFYMRAGHKRLGRLLVGVAKATEKLKDKDFTTVEDIVEDTGEKFDPMSIASRKSHAQQTADNLAKKALATGTKKAAKACLPCAKRTVKSKKSPGKPSRKPVRKGKKG